MKNAAPHSNALSGSAPQPSKQERTASPTASRIGCISYGTPMLDMLHQTLLGDMERVSGVTDQEFEKDFPVLIARIESVFRQEEQWMEEIDFPMLRQHQEQHARVLASLHNVQMHVRDGNLSLGRETVSALLPQWLTFHMSTMDTALSVAMQIAQAETEEAQQWMQKHASHSWPL